MKLRQIVLVLLVIVHHESAASSLHKKSDHENQTSSSGENDSILVGEQIVSNSTQIDTTTNQTQSNNTSTENVNNTTSNTNNSNKTEVNESLPQNTKVNSDQTITVTGDSGTDFEKFYISNNMYILRAKEDLPEPAKYKGKSLYRSNNDSNIVTVQPTTKINSTLKNKPRNKSQSNIIRIIPNNDYKNTTKTVFETNDAKINKINNKIRKLLLPKEKARKRVEIKEIKTDNENILNTDNKPAFVNPYKYLLEKNNVNKLDSTNIEYIRRKKEAMPHHLSEFKNYEPMTSHTQVLSKPSPGAHFHNYNPLTGEYKFEYNTGTHWREESRTKDGIVRGSYGWRDISGASHVTRYVADSAGYKVITPGQQVSTYVLPPSNFLEQESHVSSSSHHIEDQQFGDKQVTLTPSKPSNKPQVDYNTVSLPITVQQFNLPNKNVNKDVIHKVPSLSYESNNFEQPMTGRPPIAYPLPHTPDKNSVWVNQQPSISSWQFNVKQPVGYPTHIVNSNNPYTSFIQGLKIPATYFPIKQFINYVPSTVTYPLGHIYSIVASNSPPVHHTSAYIPGVNYLPQTTSFNYNMPQESHSIFPYNQNFYQSTYHKHPWSHNSPNANNADLNTDIYNLKPMKQHSYFKPENTNSLLSTSNANFLDGIILPGITSVPQYSQNENLNNVNSINGINFTLTKRPSNENSEYVVNYLKPWSSSVMKIPQKPVPHPVTPSLDYELLPDDINEPYANVESNAPPKSIQDIIKNLLSNLQDTDRDNTETAIKPHPLKPSKLGTNFYEEEHDEVDYIGSIKWKKPNAEANKQTENTHESTPWKIIASSKPFNYFPNKNLLNSDYNFNKHTVKPIINTPPVPMPQKYSTTPLTEIVTTSDYRLEVQSTTPSTLTTETLSFTPITSASDFLKQLLNTIYKQSQDT